MAKKKTAAPNSAASNPAASSSAAPEDSQNRFVVGLDFGTTFTSVAFAHSSCPSPEEAKLVRTWPDSATGDSSAEQVPTEVHYINPGTRERTWGYQTSGFNKGTATEPLKWFKLLLQCKSSPAVRSHENSTSGWEFGGWLANLSLSTGNESQGGDCFTPPTVTPEQKTAEKLDAIGISPAAVVCDFLKDVRGVAIDEIGRTYEKQWIQGVGTRIEYVLTVPAIWSDAAKSQMVKAAEQAGYGKHRTDFHLVSEPEAAAAYTLKAIQPNELNRGDTFIICDAGGGTVDLISYTIKNLNPLQLDETVGGTGDLCGSVFLNERFEQYIRRVLGNDVIDRMKPRSKNEMMRTWEEKVKFKFGNTSTDGFDVSVPGVPDNEKTSVEDGFHTMENDSVREIFDPVVDRIVHLVKQQVLAVQRRGNNVKAILLVGGFGSSVYLRTKLESAQYGNKGLVLPVLQPPNARSAIARGALLRGLDGSIVKERRARRSYGCAAATLYCPNNGLERHMYWSDSEDAYLVEDHMNWHIKKSSLLGNTASASLNFYRLVPVPMVRGMQPHLVFHDDLLLCELDTPPEFKWKNPGAIRKVCTVRSDLSSVRHQNFPRSTNSLGDQYYRVDYQLRLSLVDEVLQFEVIYQGQSRGMAIAKYY